MGKKAGKEEVQVPQTAEIEVENPDRERVSPVWESPRKRRAGLYYDKDREVTSFVPDVIKVQVSLRNDVLGQMLARGQITPVRYQAGRTWQRYAEEAGTPLRSPGDIQEPVDGSRGYRVGVTDKQMVAAKKRTAWRKDLGVKGFMLLDVVLIDKRSLREAANQLYGGVSRSTIFYIGRRFNECLDAIASDVGLTA